MPKFASPSIAIRTAEHLAGTEMTVGDFGFAEIIVEGRAFAILIIG